MDHESKGLAAALVRLKRPNGQDSYPQIIDLQKIRSDLALAIELYKLPALLRILQDGEEVPRTASDKAMKKKMLEQYFHISNYRPPQYAVKGVEFWGNGIDTKVNRQAWDWEGEA
jgi:malonyl-CoA/methylmalonyl-CoA synthetase